MDCIVSYQLVWQINVVKWPDKISNFFHVLSRVRQSGILSPIPFTDYRETKRLWFWFCRERYMHCMYCVCL